ncbi:MAG: type IV toxin-antitoxin system AbiEi family antitoxin domain-containing protein [Propionibacteriaceae bacterium]|jgi:predicted transcriptional regulator of viral defense system|nr:type IV toxin-antitoxin system AbiEi family antitoxin domain-containing protein [Propionibacteriaceae bacterium]
MREVVSDLDRLREVALDQHGFVRTSQALDAEVSEASLGMLARRGRLERVARGLYRVPQVPATRFDPYMKAVLWTGFPEACLSHDSALDAWEISDINPDLVHVTVGSGRRIRRRAAPAGYAIHRQDLAPEQVTWWESIPTATPATAIAQCLETGVPTYLIRQALERAGRTGLVRAPDLERLTRLMGDRYA